MPSYDFNANRDLLLSIILGDIDPASLEGTGVNVEVLSQSDPFAGEIVLGIRVVVSRIGKDFTLREVTSTKNIAMMNMDTEQFIWRSYHAIARKMARTLFEFDPRIGLPLNKFFPDCPLFDPSYIVVPYQNYLGDGVKPTLKPGITATTNIIDYRETFNTLTTCHFCMDRIAPYGGGVLPGVWCGGNVGFAHDNCAPWVEPRR
jgi:hypothetical protein